MPPKINVSLANTGGQPWPNATPGNFDFIQFDISFNVIQGSTPSDLILLFNSDITDTGSNENQGLNAVQGMTSETGLGGPGNPLANYYWRQLPTNISSIETGTFTLASGTSPLTRQVFASVASLAVGQTITSQVILSSASYGLQVSATVNTYIFASALAASPTLTPTPPPASLGHIVAYPQPANQTICFGYNSPNAGPVKIVIYNAAYQVVAEVSDNDSTPRSYTASCVTINKLVSGVYFYKTNVGGFEFPMGNFGVLR